jgi:hypothetical protein
MVFTLLFLPRQSFSVKGLFAEKNVCISTVILAFVGLLQPARYNQAVRRQASVKMLSVLWVFDFGLGVFCSPESPQLCCYTQHTNQPDKLAHN